MKIQSFSIVVPNKTCANKCPFCVSRMVNSDIYPNLIDINDPHYDINVTEYVKRMRYVANCGCQTVMLTGTSEPQQNKQFLATFALLHKQIGLPFTNIEMQTTGLFLNNNRDYIRFLRNFVGINTIALSVNSTIDKVNNEILGHNLKDKAIDLSKLCELLKEYGFNIRICLNLNSSFNDFESMSGIASLFSQVKEDYMADQITFRQLYADRACRTPQAKWIAQHLISQEFLDNLRFELDGHDTIGKTAYGTDIKEVDGMSVIFDQDCMGKNPTTDVRKYVILRPNCKLYYSWDSPASLVF